MSDFNAEEYKLSPEKNKQIFENEIVPDLLEDRRPQEHPTALFLVSQPGSGKSRLQKEVDAPSMSRAATSTWTATCTSPTTTAMTR